MQYQKQADTIHIKHCNKTETIHIRHGNKNMANRNYTDQSWQSRDERTLHIASMAIKSMAKTKNKQTLYISNISIQTEPIHTKHGSKHIAVECKREAIHINHYNSKTETIHIKHGHRNRNYT